MFGIGELDTFVIAFIIGLFIFAAFYGGFHQLDTVQPLDRPFLLRFHSVVLHFSAPAQGEMRLDTLQTTAQKSRQSSTWAFERLDPYFFSGGLS